MCAAQAMAASVAAAHEETVQRLSTALTACCADFQAVHYTQVYKHATHFMFRANEQSVAGTLRWLWPQESVHLRDCQCMNLTMVPRLHCCHMQRTATFACLAAVHSCATCMQVLEGYVSVGQVGTLGAEVSAAFATAVVGPSMHPSMNVQP